MYSFESEQQVEEAKEIRKTIGAVFQILLRL